MLYLFCTLTILTTFCACSISCGFTSLNPTWRIFPSCCSLAISPSDSSTGVFGSMRCSCHRSMRLDLQIAQAHLDLLPQVLRTPHRQPLVRPLPGQPALGGDHDALGIRRQRLADQPLAHRRSIRVRRIDEVDAQLDRPAQHLLCALGVLRLAPDALAGNPHRSKTQPVDGHVPANGKRPARTCICCCHARLDARGRMVHRIRLPFLLRHKGKGRLTTGATGSTSALYRWGNAQVMFAKTKG